MSLKHLFRIISLIALIILIIQIIFQVRKVKGGDHLSKHQVSMNWLFLALAVVAYGGSFMASNRPIHPQYDTKVSEKAKDKTHNAATDKKQTKATAQRTDNDSMALKFKSKAHLKGGKVQVAFTMPKGMKLKIQTADGKTTVGQAKNTKDQPVQFMCTFTTPGDYQVIGTNGKRQVTKKLTILPEQGKQPAAQNQTANNKQNQPAANTNNNQSTKNNNKGQDEPKKGYHYEYRQILVPNQQ